MTRFELLCPGAAIPIDTEITEGPGLEDELFAQILRFPHLQYAVLPGINQTQLDELRDLRPACDASARLSDSLYYSGN